jgi:aminopeptidase N
MPETIDHLLESFVPSHYRLFLHPNREQMTFSGTVEIRGQQLVESTVIKLHAKGLRIDSARFSIGGGTHTFNNHKHGEHDVLYLAAPQPLQGELTILLSFFGEITEPMVGLYPCNFTHDGQTKQLLATQFESHHAREVFPCIDEPAAKATFDVSLKTLAGEVVLFNTPEASSHDDGDSWITTAFETTPIMSTYLLAFVTGELAHVEQTTKTGTLTRVWVTPDNLAHTKFALDIAVKALELLEEFFGTPFPLPKVDHVGLPDFAAGAMENWGLITYREVALLVDPDNSSLDDTQWSVAVIAHELSHQWFGNLVTMHWWTDLWLNEGFASWMERYIPDKIFPDWQLWDQFVTEDFIAAQSLDSLEHSHPVEVPVNDPNDIRSIFDAISYDKGASVIRMLHAYVGAEAFVRGLRDYMETHQYANARTTDLWQAMEQASGKPVKNFMSSWTTQTGFPVVTATVKDSSVDISQERYFINPAARQSDQGLLWPLPIDSVHTDEVTTISEATGTWMVADAGATKLNRLQSSFYMTQYDDAQLQRLAAMIRDGGKLEPLDRLGLLQDAFQLAKGGYQDTVKALGLLDAYDKEADNGVWEVISGQLGAIRAVFGTEDVRAAMKPYTLDLIRRELARLGWETKPNDTHFDKLLRPLILSLASVAEEPAVLNEAHKRFVRMQRPEDIHPDLRGVVFGTIARRSHPEDYETLLKFYRESKLPQVKLQFAAALCGFKTPDLHGRSIAMINSDEVRLQEVMYWVSSLFYNRFAKAEMWGWLKKNWSWVVEKFGTDIVTFSYFPKIVGRSFADTDMVEDYSAFFSSVYTTGIDQPIAQGLESIQWRTAWRERDQAAIENYFKNWKPQG